MSSQELLLDSYWCFFRREKATVGSCENCNSSLSTESCITARWVVVLFAVYELYRAWWNYPAAYRFAVLSKDSGCSVRALRRPGANQSRAQRAAADKWPRSAQTSRCCAFHWTWGLEVSCPLRLLRGPACSPCEQLLACWCSMLQCCTSFQWQIELCCKEKGQNPGSCALLATVRLYYVNSNHCSGQLLQSGQQRYISLGRKTACMKLLRLLEWIHLIWQELYTVCLLRNLRCVGCMCKASLRAPMFTNLECLWNALIIQSSTQAEFSVNSPKYLNNRSFFCSFHYVDIVWRQL